jgi:hypothetical protein
MKEFKEIALESKIREKPKDGLSVSLRGNTVLVMAWKKDSLSITDWAFPGVETESTG